MPWAHAAFNEGASSKQVLQIRFQPIASVLDSRGKWAEALSSSLALRNWRIGKDRFDVYDLAKQSRVFVSHRNAGCVLHGWTSRETFTDFAVSFLRELFKLPAFLSGVYVQRIGIRLTAAIPVGLTFEDLVVQLSGGKKARLAALEGATIEDLAFVSNYATESGKIHTQIGPMRRDEFAKALAWEIRDVGDDTAQRPDTYPEVGIFGDIDCWKAPAVVMKRNEVEKLGRTYAGACRARLKELLELYESGEDSGNEAS